MTPTQTWIDRWIGNKAAVCLAVIFWLGLPVYLFAHGLPRLADHIAKAIPLNWEKNFGEEVYLLMQRTAGFGRSKITPEELQATHTRWVKLAETNVADPSNAKIELTIHWHSGMHNAFALPGGRMVMFDELRSELSEDEFFAIFAHELGHLHHRHVIRRMLSQTLITGSVASLYTATNSGTANTLSNFLATTFIGSAYSRDHEREADAFAVDMLQRAGMSSDVFVRAMEKLAAIQARQMLKSKGWLSTHPDPQERIDRYKNPVHHTTESKP